MPIYEPEIREAVHVLGNLCNIARLQATWDKDPGLFCTIFSNAIGHAVCDPVVVLRLGNLEVGYSTLRDSGYVHLSFQ